jgi:hypothetical protein
VIDERFISENKGVWEGSDDQVHTIDVAKTTDLMGKAHGQEKE